MFPRVSRPVREVYHSPPSSAKVKNRGSNASAPSKCLPGVHRDNFVCFIGVPNNFTPLLSVS